MTSPKVLEKLPSTPPVYYSRRHLSPDERYAIAYRKIFGAKTEHKKWVVLFGSVSHLLEGLPEGQRRALMLAAIWRLAKSNVRTLSRRKHVENILSIGHDAAEIVGEAGFSRLDTERIAVDAFQMMAAKAFKRRRATHAADDL
jgi:hypothetical protein